MKALALCASPLIAVFALIVGVTVVLVPTPDDALELTAACAPQVPGGPDELRLDDEQWQVSRTIIDVAKSLTVGERGWVIALAAGLQESGLRPLTYGDRDSLGVFQQRASWGSAHDRINPVTAARMFFTGGHAGQRGLLDIPGWQAMSVTEAAQAVQVSAYPDAYAKWEGAAVHIVQVLEHVDASCHNTVATGAWTSPLPHSNYVLTAGFGECGLHWAHCHTGQDFAVPTGTPVVSVGDGVVIFAGWDGPYGNAVHVLHPAGIATWYAHLSRITVHPGQSITGADVIGLSGATGNTTGPHLHFEVRTGASLISTGTPIDPMPWLHQQHVL